MKLIIHIHYIKFYPNFLYKIITFYIFVQFALRLVFTTTSPVIMPLQIFYLYFLFIISHINLNIVLYFDNISFQTKTVFFLSIHHFNFLKTFITKFSHIFSSPTLFFLYFTQPMSLLLSLIIIGILTFSCIDIF